MFLEIPVVIDRTSPVPLYHQLAQQLMAAIDQGVLAPGVPFGYELAMAVRPNLSRPTVRRAISELVNAGLLVRRRGIGTTVASQVIHRRSELTSLHEDLVRSGRTPRTEVLEFDDHHYDANAATKLGLAVDTPLVYIERLRFVGDMPIALMHNWLPPTAEITREQLEEHGLYEVLREQGIKPHVAHQTIGARRPAARERKLLELTKGDPLLTMYRIAYDANGTAIEFGDHVYRSDQHAFDVVLNAT